MSMRRPLNAWATLLAPSLPTGATTLTGAIKLAASAKYTAEPPSVSLTLPNGPSRVSRATEPATRRSGGLSGTAASPAARCDDVPRQPQLLQKILWAGVVLDLHPAPAQLAGRVRVRSCRADFAQVGCETRRRLVGGGFTPGVIGLDDVDAIREIDHALATEMSSIPVEGMRYVSEPAHVMDHVHCLLWREIWRDAARDEQPDDLTLTRLGFLSNDGQGRRHLGQGESPFNRIVVGQGDAVEAAFGAALNQLVERALAIVREVRVKVEVDPHRWAPAKESRLL